MRGRGGKEPGYGCRRSRRALARARLTNGASAATEPRPSIRAVSEACAATAFSPVMRQYSAALQVPCAIIMVRRSTVSHDAAVNTAIVMGKE